MLGDSKLNFKNLKHSRIFEIFEELTKIPHGSENCEGLAEYCVNFARRIGLDFYRDSFDNVIIYKPGTSSLEQAPAIILQGHLDMVCQKTAESNIDFLTDPLKLILDGDFLTAEGTTLGGDNGIAVAMVLAILEDDNLVHPPIEAVFTSDEEIGMIGAGKLDMSVLKGRRMVNIDAEEDDTVIVSCAGGCDFNIKLPLSYIPVSGGMVTVEFKGLQGGHSGVEINSGRENANKLSGALLNFLNDKVDFEIISVNGGDKGNAITNYTALKLCSNNIKLLCELINEYESIVKNEIADREKNFELIVTVDNTVKERHIIDNKSIVIHTLANIPNGVLQMSNEIENLVETSLNLGIVKTCENYVYMLTALRSNKEDSLLKLQDELKEFFKNLNAEYSVAGYYPPWEYKSNSSLQKCYINSYEKVVKVKPKVNAIHAGLECAVFASRIKDIDCIAIGPNIYDVHTVNEKLSISSTIQIFEVLIDLLSSLK